jgi:hypothetical protein
MAHVHRRAFLGASAAIAVGVDSVVAQAPVTNIKTGWGAMTRSDRDAAYNVNAAVSDSAELIQLRASRSTILRSQRSKYLDMAYGPAERNKWDLFPGEKSNAPSWSLSTAVTGKEEVAKEIQASLRAFWHEAGQPHCLGTH